MLQVHTTVDIDMHPARVLHGCICSLDSLNRAYMHENYRGPKPCLVHECLRHKFGVVVPIGLLALGMLSSIERCVLVSSTSRWHNVCISSDLVDGDD